MKRTLVCVVGALLLLSGCPDPKVVLREPGSFRPRRPVTAPKFVVLPAVDQRPQWEKEGDNPGVTLRIAGPGAAMFWWAGADVTSDETIVYGRNRFRGQGRTARTMVSSDLGEVLQRSTRRPVDFWNANLVGQRQVANAVRRKRLPDGSVVVLPVIDHLARVRAKTKQASSTQSKTYTSTHVITTTRTSRASQTVGPVWSVMVRLHVFEVRRGRVARHVVRYAAASAGNQRAYARAIVNAARQVAFTSSVIFPMANLPRVQPGTQPTQPGTQPTQPGPTPQDPDQPEDPDGVPAEPAQPAQPSRPPNTNPPI